MQKLNYICYKVIYIVSVNRAINEQLSKGLLS